MPADKSKMRAAVTTSLNLTVRGSRRQWQETKKTRSQISFAVRLHFTADGHTASRAASSTRSHLPVIRRCPGPSQPVSLAMLTARLVPGRLLRTGSGIWTAVVQLAHALHLDLSYRLSRLLKVVRSQMPFCGRRLHGGNLRRIPGAGNLTAEHLPACVTR
jgi:hypothetical protein